MIDHAPPPDPLAPLLVLQEKLAELAPKHGLVVDRFAIHPGHPHQAVIVCSIMEDVVTGEVSSDDQELFEALEQEIREDRVQQRINKAQNELQSIVDLPDDPERGIL